MAPTKPGIGAVNAERARVATRRRFQDMGPTLFDLPKVDGGDLPPPMRATAPRQPAPETSPALDLANSIILGVNAQGNLVRRLADGRRLTESRGGYRHLEEPGRPAGLYLRAETDADLGLIAEGVINQLSEGKHVSAQDMSRLAAIMVGGDGTAPASPDQVRRLLTAADDLMMAKIRDASPVTRSRAIAARFHRFSSKSWRELGVSRDTIPARRIFSEINATVTVEISSDALTPDWVANTLAPQIAALPDDARLLVRIATGRTYDADDFRTGIFADCVRQNIIESVAHLRAPMAAHNQALLVFGPPRPAKIDPTAIPVEAFDAPVISSPEEAWDWLDRTEAASALARQWMDDFRAGRAVETPEEVRQPNQFQAPYVGLSKAPARNLMVPAALAAATAEALQNLGGRVGDVDEYVAREVGIPVDKLVEVFT
ncbi:MAG: hypothetical protein KGL65_10375, partial [Rhodospirillales bacterium]|nr:hypothetical protein [Rhodospirillales bacterium]